MALSIRNSLRGTINKYKILVLQDTIDINGSLLPSGTIIVMGGTGTAKLAYTVNGGTSWTAVSLFSTSGQAIAYGLQRLVAVGQGGNTLITSENGTTWTTVASPFSTIGYDIIFDETKWIGVGQGGATLAYSGVGGSWTTVSGVFTTAGYGLLYDSTNQLYIAAGEGTNTLATSVDGINWTGTSPLTTRSYGAGGPATYTDNSATLFVSRNVGTLPSSFFVGNNSNYTNYIIYNNRIYIGGSPSGKIGYSYDGRTWTQTYAGFSSSYAVNDIQYGNGVYIASCGSNYSSPTNTLAISTDGFNWSGKILHNGGTFFCRYGNGIWVASGATSNSSYRTVFSTDNGTTWTTATVAGGLRMLKAAYGNDKFIGMGFNSTSFKFSALSTTTGAAWTTTQSLITAFSSINDFRFANGIFVATGQDSQGNTLAYSSDGITWTYKNMIFGTNQILFSSAFLNGTWYVSSNIGVAISSDNFNTISIVTSTITTSYGYTVNNIYKPKYIVAGQGVTSMQGSIDGTNWYSLPSPFTVAAKNIAWSSSLSIWVAVGEGTHTIAWSDNGINWTGLGTTYFSTRGNKVKYDLTSSKFYAVGEGTNRLISSTDGKSWTIISTTGAVTTAGIGVCVV
jgi:hypothetical protein